MRSSLVVAVIISACVTPQAGAQRVRPSIETSHYTIDLSPRDGHIVAITDRASGRSLLVAPLDTGSLWTVRIRDGETWRTLAPRDARAFRTARPRGMRGALHLTWSDFGVRGAPALAVVATARPTPDGTTSEWRLRIDGMAAGGIDSLRFPRVTGIASPGDSAELAVPLWMGQRTREPQRVLRDSAGIARRLEWVYPGQLSLQALGYYDRRAAGLYLAANDTLAWRKSFAMWGEGNAAAGYEMLHLPENPATATRYAMPYGALVGTFTGDWLTVAERYRDWGTRQAWARNSRLTRGLVPRWMQETAMWVWNRGRSPMVLQPALTLRRELGLPVSVFWHWWHKGAYDTSFPDYLPPREGSDAFRDAVRDAKARGVHAIVYMNQRLWCLDTPSWIRERGERAAVRNPDGSIRTEVYNIFDPKPCATMDVSTPQWRAKYAGIGEEVLRDLGLSGIYMDQAVLSLVCHSAEHGHPIGGGHYWMDGFRTLAREIRGRAPAGSRVGLAGEGGGESWMPELDEFLTLQVSVERYQDPSAGWEVIPFFQAVYHAHALSYGTYSSLAFPPYDDLWPKEFAPANALTLLDARFTRQFRLEQARAFVWGMQPTIANFLPEQLEARRPEIDFALQLAKLRRGLDAYFVRGTFMRPPSSDAPLLDVPLSRVSIYAARRGGATEAHRREPSLQLGAFRAADGRVAIAGANIGDDSLTTTLSIDPAAWGLASGARVARIVAGRRRPLATIGARNARLPLVLSPREAFVLEVTPP